MKKLMLAGLVIALYSGSANGQTADNDHESKMMEFGIAGGLNIASNNCVVMGGEEGSADFAYGFVGNIFVDHALLPDLKARFGVGVVYGGSDTRFPVNGVPTLFKTRTVYLDFPMLAKYDIVGLGHHSLYGLAGVNVGYLLSAKTNDVKMENMRNFDLGLLGGLGISMPVASRSIFFEAKYSYGLVNTSAAESEELKNRGIRLTAGVTL